jgi:monoamine oxidase
MKVQSRRDFIALMALATAGMTILPYCKKKPAEVDTDEDILVIGAGIAGLAAARKLAATGFRVTVLEASQRYGGRIKTVDMGGYKADFGASWIHGINGNPLYELANAGGIITKPTYYDPSYIYDIDGTEITASEWRTIDRYLGQLVEMAGSNPDVSLQQLLNELTPELDLSDKMMRLFFGGVRSEIEIPYAVDAPDIAARALTTNDSFPGRDVIFPGGMSQLTDDLAVGLDIRYGTFVSEISYSGDKVNVFTKNTADIDSHRSCVACHTGTIVSPLDHDEVFTADRVIVALPLGILKNEGVKFDPVLPQDKQAAINSLGIGTMNKIFLRFPDNFWPENGYFFEYLKEDYSKIIEFFSPTPTGTENIIVAVLAGEHARSMEKKNDDEVRELAMDDLRGMFGSGIPQPVEMKLTAWHTDPLSLGSYPHLKPGADLTACDKIAMPLGNKVFFAGDATSSKYMATAHGAYISGMDAAEAIILLNS